MSWLIDVNMFRIVAVAGFAAVVAAILLHFIVSKPKFDDVFGENREQERSLVGVLRKLFFLLAILCFIILALTGFIPRVAFGVALSGWWLMIHATAAPIFAACVAILAVLWADRKRLDKNYWPSLNRILRRQPQSIATSEKHELKLRICFWIILAMSLPVILAAVMSMFPIFGTHGQESLLQIHRYSTLFLSLFVIKYLYLAALIEMNRTAAK